MKFTVKQRIKILYITIKEMLSRIRHKFEKDWREKRKSVLTKTKKYSDDVISQLNNLGYENVRKYSLSTWKYYGEDKIRLTFIGKKGKDKFIIKVTKECVDTKKNKLIEEKIRNSIRFQTRFNDEFDFIPKGYEIKLNGYLAYATEYIASYPFSWIRYLVDTNDVGYYIRQANDILDSLNQHRIVHCDLEAINILISIIDHKLYIIDWDTTCSESGDLWCDNLPLHTIKKYCEDGRVIYDDAYSMYVLFKRFFTNSIEEIPDFAALERRIGRNTHVTLETNNK